MKVAVRYMAQLRQAAGAACEEVELDRPCGAAELLTRLAERHGRPYRDLLLAAAGGVRPAVLLCVGDEQASAATRPLRDGDVLTVLTPMAGG